MAVYVVGDFIKEIRLRKGYTQEMVSFGICTPASLSRIENGVQMPGRYILDKLLERLGTENQIFNVFVSREEMEWYETTQALLRSITDGNLPELEKQIARMEEMAEDAPELERQCLIFAKGELLLQSGGDREEAIRLLMKAIHISLPDFDGKTPLKRHLLTFDEISIINSIAVQHADAGRIAEALKLGEWLKEYLEEKIIDGKMKRTKYPMILYNLSNWLAKKKRYEEALEMTDIGVDFCIKFGNLVAFPLLIFNKACSLAELGEQEKAKQFFNQSIAIFEAMKQYDRMEMASDWCKKHYQIEI